jgi:hypothetical protein
MIYIGSFCYFYLIFNFYSLYSFFILRCLLFMVYDLGLRVWGLRFEVWGLVLRFPGSRFRGQEFGLRVRRVYQRGRNRPCSATPAEEKGKKSRQFDHYRSKKGNLICPLPIKRPNHITCIYRF